MYTRILLGLILLCLILRYLNHSDVGIDLESLKFVLPSVRWTECMVSPKAFLWTRLCVNVRERACKYVDVRV